MKIFSIVLFVLVNSANCFAADGDTIHVSTIPFAGPQSGTYWFPADSVRYHKVLMHYTCKCPTGGCGQWDYLDYVYLDQHKHNPDTTIRYELMRYITPYGINLNLGTGFTWTMDVTDFSLLLHDSVTLDAGNGNENVQLTFDIILGTPPHDVKSITPLWNGSPRYGLSPPIDSFLVPMFVQIDPATKGVRLKIIQTGHGEDNHTDATGNGAPCAEFCDNVQYINVSDTVRYRRHVFRNTCGLNPVYPQGGTWPLNRANWCPGAQVDPFDYELSPFANPGHPLKVQMTMDPYTYVPGATNDNTTPYYVISSNLFQYGAPNFQNDASIEQIFSPNNNSFYNRQNPICNGPSIFIRNSGANDLKSLTINYGARGGKGASYKWTGDLKFLEGDTVQLPSFDWGTWTGPNIFDVTISQPNDVADEYAINNSLSSTFDTLPTWYNDLEIHLHTNTDAAAQYEWWLTSSDGTTLADRSNLADNTSYIDTFHLADGCYQFRLVNYWGYGLSFFATTSQLGSGSLSFTSKGAAVKSFSGDFGEQIFQQFRVGPQPAIAMSADTLNFGVVPVNQTKQLTAKVFPVSSVGVTVSGASLVIARGQFTIISSSPSIANGPVTLAPGDTMSIVVQCNPNSTGSKFAKLNVNSNDARMPSASFTLVGVTDSSLLAVQQRAALSPDDYYVRVFPTIVSTASTVSFFANGERATVRVVDALGKTVASLFDGATKNEIVTTTMSASGISAGTYFIVMQSEGTVRTVPVVVVK